MSANLLIVWHSRTGAARQMADALAQGARLAAAELDAGAALTVELVPAGQASAAQLLRAGGYLFCAPENLAALSGEMKEFFDRCYYNALDQLNGRPYALAVSAGSDGQGAVRQMARICQGWRLRAAAEPLIVLMHAQTPQTIAAPKIVDDAELERCRALGGLLAATVLMGVG